MSTVLLAVGDASGDVYAADFVRALRALRPEACFRGLGGGEMEKAGVELVVHQRDFAVGGLVELAPQLTRIASAWRCLGGALRAPRPDLVVLVDSGGFNLPFARRAKRAGIPVLYYVAPQVWAWRRGRIRKIARRVDRLAVIFPFEPAVYAGTGVAVEFVGHPLVDRIGGEAAPRDRDSARRALGLSREAPLVALFPGSRRNELRHCLGLQLETARILHARDPRIGFVLPLAPSIERSRVEGTLRSAGLPFSLRLDLVAGRSLEVLSACDVALVKPGTATVEAMLLGRPLVVTGRGNALSAAVIRRLLKVDWLAMPNLIAGEAVVPEFIQQAADPDRVAEAVAELLEGPARAAQLERLAALGARLGSGGAARRTAEIAAEMMVARRGP